MKHFQTGESSRASGELILYEAARELNRARRVAEREQHEAESARATAKRLRRAERRAEILRFREQRDQAARLLKRGATDDMTNNPW